MPTFPVGLPNLVRPPRTGEPGGLALRDSRVRRRSLGVVSSRTQPPPSPTRTPRTHDRPHSKGPIQTHALPRGQEGRGVQQ